MPAESLASALETSEAAGLNVFNIGAGLPVALETLAESRGRQTGLEEDFIGNER